MVLEALYKPEWLMKKTWMGLILGLAYSIIGIGMSVLLFPNDPALVAVIFTSILLFPTFYNLFKIEKKKEEKEKTFNIMKLWKDNKTIIKIFLFVSLGIFIVFSLFSIMLPSMATNHLFKQQLEIMSTGQISGNAISTGLFTSILNNNLIVFVFIFILSLLVGSSGAIFLITWNLSVWATIFGNISRTAALSVGKNPFIYFLLVLLSVLPHAFLELFSYILAAISGGVISKTFITDRFSKRFVSVLVYNLILFVIAIIILIIAALVETYVLQTLGLYKTIIMQSFGAT